MAARETIKKVTFDPMSFMHSNMADRASVETTGSRSSRLSSKALAEKLTWQEANPKYNFFERDLFPDSSDSSSDEFDFPETLVERVHRIYFARRRKQHYNEAANRALARKLIHEEFGSQTFSSQGSKKDEEGIPDEAMTECSMCIDESSEGSYPFFQQLDSSSVSTVDEAELKDEPEPGFQPSHRCYETLTGYNNTVTSNKVVAAPKSPEPSHDRIPDDPVPETTDRPRELPSAHIPTSFTDSRMLADNFYDMAEDRNNVLTAMERWLSMKHTRVMDKGKNWDLDQSRNSEDKRKDRKSRSINVSRGQL